MVWQKSKEQISNMKYKYWLPDKDGHSKEQETENNAVILIGANGAGKSHLGAWIEQQNMRLVHRIASQRSLNFDENIPQKNYSQSEDLVFFGTDSISGSYKDEKMGRWGDRSDNLYTTKLIDDFNGILSALIALYNNETSSYLHECENAEKIGKEKPAVPRTVLSKLLSLWSEVFPLRELIYEDGKFFAKERSKESERYPANKMSDGERAVLYFAAQVLCVPEGKILIIDEPELHLHRSLSNRLWSSLEKFRPDLLFIYITHDTDFGARHQFADKYWVTAYHGNNQWEIQKIEGSSLPEDLLLTLLGNRKNIIFVEGDENSFDSRIYSLIYKDYFIVPCGGCEQVKSYTKAFRNESQLSEFTAYGIIDRDFHSDEELEKYKDDHVYCLKVAEVENLFITEEMFKAVADLMACKRDSVSEAINFVWYTKFDNLIDRQVCAATISTVKEKLSGIEIRCKKLNDVKSAFDQAIDDLDVETIKAEIENKFNSLKSQGSYSDILKIFNEKSVSKEVGHFFGITDNDYRDNILRQLNAGKQDFIESVKKYLPDSDEIPY